MFYLEFSFDRGAKPQKQNNDTQTSADPFADARSQHLKSASSPSPQFQTQSASNSSGDSAEDRLKKAIERNRAKQEMRGAQSQPQQKAWSPGQVFNKEEVRAQPQPQAQTQQAQPQQKAWSPGQVFNKEEVRAQPQPQPQPQPQQARPEQKAWSPGQVFNKPDSSSQPGLFQQPETNANENRRRPEAVQPQVLNRENQKPLSERLAEAQKESFNRASIDREPPASPGARVNTRTTAGGREAPNVDILEKKIPTSRAVVARDRRVTVEEEFTTPVKKAPKKITTPAYATKKSGGLDPKWQSYLVRGCWAFCALMLVRLFFSQGGVLDYYDQSKILSEKKLELEQIKSENLALTKEISRMMSDVGYQKKIVRDNLGFIAQDEFLILFPKE